MKVLPFTIPVPHDKTIIVQKDVLPYFYPHLHRHEEIQLTWIQQGEGTLIADNNMHAFKSNEIFWLGANQPHIFKSDPVYFLPKSKKKITATVLFFNPNGPLSSLLNLPEINNIKRFLQQNANGFKIPSDKVMEIANKMILIKKSTSIEQMIHFMDLLKLVSSLSGLEPLSAGSRPKLYSENEGLRMSNIYNFIIQEYEKPITLEDAANKAHMTPHAFCRYFKKHTRHTFLSFLNEVRINEACKKLTNESHVGIANVAYSCGFNSITNFNRIFKRVKGKSPSEYVESYFRSTEEYHFS
ncbi:AraC family transcriptional regulator [Flectobacillus major]|jgi:AraC-like DNA-binding protein|uniref:AraC family transcriptional regulator n=1 Tax=Flectobacillus major TaxID=103 RepID=UPI00041F9DD1|nr:AraC family transcriptional regulator [Flectobacillus major]